MYGVVNVRISSGNPLPPFGTPWVPLGANKPLGHCGFWVFFLILIPHPREIPGYLSVPKARLTNLDQPFSSVTYQFCSELELFDR